MCKNEAPGRLIGMSLNRLAATHTPLRRTSLVLVCAWIALHGQSLVAQQAVVFGSISGTIRDSATGPLTNAYVASADGKLSARTDTEGHFVLEGIPAGTATIFVHSDGYPGRDTTVELIAGRKMQLDIWLRPYGYVPAAQLLLQTDSGGTGEYDSVDKAQSAAYPDFSISLFRTVVAKDPDHNMFLSPASAAFALAMTASGASGATWTAMSKVLGADAAHQDALAEQSVSELRSLESQTGVQLQIANSIWAAQGRPFRSAFLSGAKQSYRAEVTSLVLHGNEAMQRINAWVSKATNDRISSILTDTLPENANMMLLNAVYFKGKWIDPFDSTDTKPHGFALPHGRVELRQLMERQAFMLYGRDTNVQVVRLPYQGGRIAMYVLLPDSGKALSKLVSGLTPKRFARFIRSLEKKDVHLELPRFRLESGADLTEPLSKLGMGIAFDHKLATFGRMLPADYLKEHNVWIDDVVQKSWVEVNEQGTEAAAVTAVAMLTEITVTQPPVPIEFIVDRPFLVAIRDDRTGLLLFLGQITDPVQQ